MLNLTFKLDECFKIGDQITLKVVKISQGRVELCMDVPRDIKVSRLATCKIKNK